MKLLTREELLNPTELKTEKVQTPELGEDTGVILRELGAYERSKLNDEFGDDVNLSGTRAMLFLGRLLAGSIIGEDGELLCTEDGDVVKLLGHNPDLIKRLGDIAMPLSGIGTTEEGDEPEAVKNSGSEE